MLFVTGYISGTKNEVMLRKMISRSEIINVVIAFVLFVLLWLLFSLGIALVLTFTCILGLYSREQLGKVSGNEEKTVRTGKIKQSGNVTYRKAPTARLEFGDEYSPTDSTYKLAISSSVRKRLVSNFGSFNEISRSFASFVSGFQQNTSTPLPGKIMTDKLRTGRTLSSLTTYRSPVQKVHQKRNVLSSSGPLLSSPFLPQVKRALGLNESSYLR